MKKVVVLISLFLFSFLAAMEQKFTEQGAYEKITYFSEFIPYLQKLDRTNNLKEVEIVRPQEVLCFDDLLKKNSLLWTDLFNLSEALVDDEPFEKCEELLDLYRQNTYKQLDIFSQGIECLLNPATNEEFSRAVEDNLEDNQKQFFKERFNTDFSLLHNNYLIWRSLRIKGLHLVKNYSVQRLASLPFPCLKESLAYLSCITCMGQPKHPFAKPLKKAMKSIALNGEQLNILVMNK
jgi:hypothetical protein